MSQHCDEEVGEHYGETIDKLQDLKEAVEFQDHEEEVAGADTEEDCVEGKAAKYWKAAADGEVKYYKERD